MDLTPRPADRAPATVPDPAAPTLLAMLAEVLDLGAGLTVMLLPFLATALPGVVLVLVLPAALLALLFAVPAMLVAALVAPPYLLVRAARRRRRRRARAAA
jgi:Flp pilus assembly protein TadB